MLVKPARKLKPSTSKSICRFASTKSFPNKNIMTEVILEMNFCYHLEFDSDVIHYQAQPITLNFIDSHGTAREYTPDFEVHYRCGLKKYVEIKPKKYIANSRVSEYRYEIELKIRELGYIFEIVSEDYIEQAPLLENYKKLYRYRRQEYLEVNSLNIAQATIKEPTTIKDLLKQLNGIADLKQVYVWLALGALKFNISGEELSVMTEVRFNEC